MGESLFRSDLVESSWDVFWAGVPSDLLPAGHRDTLVLSQPFASGGPEEQQLLKMLSACKLAADNYHIIQLPAERSLAWHALREQTAATKVWLLGIPPAQLGISALFVPNAVNRFDGATWMPTLSLDQLMDNAALKQQLWVQVLQPVYTGKQP